MTEAMPWMVVAIAPFVVIDADLKEDSTSFTRRRVGQAASLKQARQIIRSMKNESGLSFEEFIVYPNDGGSDEVEIYHRHDGWTFNAKGEARPAYFSSHSVFKGEKGVQERFEPPAVKSVRVGDRVRIEFSHHSEGDPRRVIVRRVTKVTPDIDWSANGARSYGWIEYEVDKAVDMPFPNTDEYHTSCALCWVTDIVERASGAVESPRNIKHEHWKNWCIMRKERSTSSTRLWGETAVDDAFYEERPYQDVSEAARYVLNRQATMRLDRGIDADLMLAQLKRDSYPGCHFKQHPWTGQMVLQVRSWKKFRKWVLRNHRRWVVAAKDMRLDCMKAAKERDDRDMRDMDREWEADRDREARAEHLAMEEADADDYRMEPMDY